jgi:hypothetical protein
MVGSKPGPVGKRPEELIRQNKPDEGNAMVEVSAEQLASLPFRVETLVEPPEPEPNWHPVAQQIYAALLRDPARLWMGPAAWAIAWLMCENVSREMYPQAIGIVDGGIDPETGDRVAGHVARESVPMKGTTINALLKWSAANGLHESERMAIRKVVGFNAVDQPIAPVDDDDVVIGDRDFFIIPGEQDAL